MKQSNFILFADCIPVKGSGRSIICDTRNNNYYFIPNGLFDILEKYNGKTIEKIKNDFEYKYAEIIDEYFDFLIRNRLIFFHSNPELFPKINTEWHCSSLITNIIIDYEEIIHDFNALVPQFEVLKCSHIQLRFYKEINIDYLKNVLSILKIEKSRIVSVDFILPYYKNFNIEELYEMIKENSRIHSFTIFNSPFAKSYEPLHQKMGYIILSEKNVTNEKHCGIINDEYFYSNIKLLSESQQHNTCLNKKISIDKYGNIKNCPSIPDSYGNIQNTTLIDALKKDDFKKYWNVSKDQIETCKDCEFRHICTDCRAYIEDPEDIYSKPLKCGYNPYTNKWSEWSTNPLKQKTIEFYRIKPDPTNL